MFSSSASASSRPSSVASVGSGTSNASSKSGKNRGPDRGIRPNRGPRPGQDVCISEEVKIGINLAVERFRMNEGQKELEFPSSLTATERAYIHRICDNFGFGHKSKGKDNNRYLTITKKDTSKGMKKPASLQLVKNSCQQIHGLLQRFPVTNKERLELMPKTDKNQVNEVSKELARTATGRLNNGVSQVPPRRGESDLDMFRLTLPIMKYKDQILSTIEANQISLVSGETGSGKTTQVPQLILDSCYSSNRPCRIFCTQPRRIAALTIAERVATERGEKIGQTVGFQIRLESRVSPKTLLTFCTNGVLLRTLMGNEAALSTVTHVVVDEVHERDKFCDFLLISLREVARRQPNIKIILMSAALNTQLFLKYFGNCPVISVPGSLFPVEEYYLEDVLKWTGYTNPKMEKYKREKARVAQQSENLIKWFENEAPEPGKHKKVKSELNWRQFQHYNPNDEFYDDSDREPDDREELHSQLAMLGKEKEELEPWVAKEMDEHLTEIWLTGNEDLFPQIFHLIVSENISVDYQHSQTSITPLMIAAGRGFSDVVEQLLNMGADAAMKGSNDWTALDWAKKFQRDDIVDILEAHLSTVENHEERPLSYDEDIAEEDRENLTVYQHCWDDDKVDVDLVASLLHKIVVTQPEALKTHEKMHLSYDEIIAGKDRESLIVYQHCLNDYKVDVDLVASLLHKIVVTQPEGAVLVFLPGYDDIVALRGRIDEEKRFEHIRYSLFILHSAMQSVDQKKVFKPAPGGTRKIIFATNIAETSITINDVVYVIDAGKVKEKTFDALLQISMLKSNWISKASALQRRGRAGRVRPGICYHMFSKTRHNSMLDFATPELLRCPLEEICLQTKLLAPVNESIANFLSKSPDPPPFLVTRAAVNILKQMDALDQSEELTELGRHLADLPVDPHLGKMVLNSIVLKCLDPVLTIVCSLSYKDPFLLPPLPYQKREVNALRKEFSAGTNSDHMVLLRAFQAWQKARTDGWEKAFCSRNFLSSAVMEMIVGMRAQLLGQLRASGFVRARGGGDIRDLNTNSENWAVVKAALCAGAYPNVIRIDRQKRKLVPQKNDSERVVPHMLSVIHKEALGELPSDWLFYEENTRASTMACIRTCTLVSPVTVTLFAGPAKLGPEALKDNLVMSLDENLNLAQPDSDSENEDVDFGNCSTLQLSEFMGFKVEPEVANLVLQLRQKWNCLFLRRMRTPSKPWSQIDEAVIRTVVTVLTNEEQAMGLQQPAGIGQRPRPMSAETIMSSGSVGRSYVSHDEMVDNGHHRFSTSAKKATSTPPKRKDFMSPKIKSNNSSANNSPLIAGESGNSTPLSSPPYGSQQHKLTDMGASVSGPDRFFVMKCASLKNIDSSVSKGAWATSVANEKKFNKALQNGKNVYMIFSVQGSGHFQGYAKLNSTSSHEKSSEFGGQGGVFSVEWIKRGNLPFQSTHHLENPWNEGKRVQISRDGQEIEPTIGRELVRLWEYSPDRGSPGARAGKFHQSQNFKSPHRKPFSQSQPQKNYGRNSSQEMSPEDYVAYGQNQGADFDSESQGFQGQSYGFQGQEFGFQDFEGQGYTSWSQGHQNVQGHQQQQHQNSPGFHYNRQGFGSQGQQGHYSGASGHGFYGNYQGQSFHGYQGREAGFQQMGVGFNPVFSDHSQRVNSPQYSRSPVTILQRDNRSHRN